MKMFFSVCFCLVGYCCLAQSSDQRPFRMSGGLSLAIPTNNLEYVSIGAGVDVNALYALSEKLQLVADIGYTGLVGKYGLPLTGVVPLRGGLRYFPAEHFYLTGKAGGALYTFSNVSINYAAYSFGGGGVFNRKFDVAVTYDGYSNKGSFGYMSLRLGYFFLR